MNNKYTAKVMIVDDEPNSIKVLSAILIECGYYVIESFDAENAIKIIQKEDVDAIVTDLKMPGKGGMQFFNYLTENYPDIPVIFLTAYGTVESAVNAVTHGAFYYFIKPPDYQKLRSIIAKAVEQRQLKKEIELLKQKLHPENRQRITGNTNVMHTIINTIEAIKNSASTILICGETGTGKEIIAKELHYSSVRKDRPFVAFNCAAIPRELVESELFG